MPTLERVVALGQGGAPAEPGWEHALRVAPADLTLTLPGDPAIPAMIKEIIVKGGSNVSPGEIEEVLDDHPQITISGVVGVPNPCYLELVHAFIELVPNLQDPPTEHELAVYAGEKLAAYKVPDRWTFVTRSPKNDVGKIDRNGLHAEAARLDS